MKIVGSPSTTNSRKVVASLPLTGRQVMGRSKRSLEQIARISQHIEEQQVASSAQLCALVGLDAGTMSRYLRHMCNAGIIYRARRHCSDPGRTHPALYCSNDTHATIEAWSAEPPVVRKITDWPRGTAFRDPLVAALFGPARPQLVA